MRMQPSADQRELIDAVTGPVAEILPLERLHRGADGERARLGSLAELGVLGIALGEDHGGSGLTATEEALLFEQLGRQLASPAILASTLAAHIAAAEGDAAKAGAIATGTEAVALAIPAQGGTGILLIDAGEAPAHVLLLGPDGPALHAGATLGERRLLDADQWSLPLEAASLTGAGVRGGDDLAIRASLLCAAQLAGIAGSARDMGVDYAKLREQFGKPIGSFQALKHRAADLKVKVEMARQLVDAAIPRAGDADAALWASMAKFTACHAYAAVAAEMVQMHGGIGVTAEHSAHLYLKRASLNEAIFGSSALHQDRAAEALMARAA